MALLPVVTLLGFSLLGLWPTVVVLILFESVRRAVNYAVSKPSRESLYSNLSEDEKYAAKNFIDTFVYRGGDAIGAWSFGLIRSIGLTLSSMAWVAVPITMVWLWISTYLGRRIPSQDS